MKKFLSLILIILLCSPLFFMDSKITYAESGTITADKVVSDDPYVGSCDISFINNDIIFLNKGSQNPFLQPQILIFNGQPITLQIEPIFLCTYDNEYFYATRENVYCYPNTNPIGSFNYISDIVVSSKSLFIIDNTSALQSIIYKFNPEYNTENPTDPENPSFKEFTTYSDSIEKFAYNEVSKNCFAYNGEKVIISGKNNLTIPIENITEMLCDFEGNLYLFKTSLSTHESVFRYSYESDYTVFASYNIDFSFDEPNTYKINQVIAADYNQSTGEFALLCCYNYESSNNYNIYKISKDKLETKTSIDIPPVIEFENLKLSELDKLNFYAAEIADYPSNRLYPADIIIGGTKKNKDINNIEEIAVGEKVLVFLDSDNGKFSFILYKNKFAVIYNNSLIVKNERRPEFEQGRVLLNRSKIYSCPSNFIYDKNQEYSFIIDEIEKDASVEVKGEIEFYGVTYCRIAYGNNKTGYINKAELTEHSKIAAYDSKLGRIDSNRDIPLYKNKDALSEQIVMLPHKQEIKVLETGNDFCYIEVLINGETHYGYVETKYVLIDGLTHLQKLGIWIFLCASALAAAAILLRVFVVKRRKKQTAKN